MSAEKLRYTARCVRDRRNAVLQNAGIVLFGFYNGFNDSATLFCVMES